MRISVPVLLCFSLLLAACGKAPQNPAPVPATSTAPASVSAPAASTATAASTAPAATSAAAAVTSQAAAVSTTVAPDAATTTGPEVAGSVALSEGSVTDTAKDGSSRQLKDGDSVYPGDSFVLGVDSYLDLDLEDTGRILLRPNTTFQIQSYHYDADAHDANGPTDANGQPLIKPASAQPESAFFKLVKGGLRAVDGIIGKTEPQSYGVETPVATIGVRGTAFDVRYCGDDCTDEADSGGKPDNGLYTSVSEGSIGVKNDSGETVTPAGHSSFVKSRKERVQALAVPPKALRHMDLPEKLKARSQKNRNNIQVRRQKRRQLIVQHRQAMQKARAAGGLKPGPAEKGAKPETRKERREERREKLQEQRKGGAAAGTEQGKPGAAEKGGKPETPMERRQQRREQLQEQRKAGAAPAVAQPAAAAGQGNAREQMKEKRQERREQRQQQANPAAATPPDKQPAKTGAAATQDKQPAKADEKECKNKKKRRKDGKCDDGS